MADAVARWGGEARISTAGSQVLRRQILEGARADLFVPASDRHVRGKAMEAVFEPPVRLGCNAVVVVVPRSSPVRSLEDLPRAERLVIGTPEVPIGAYADRLLERAGRRFGEPWRRRVLARVISRELDVRQVLAKVTLGEADAAIVYGSDAADAEVRTIRLPPELAVSARYPIALSRHATRSARSLARWLRSDAGRALLLERGFEPCAGGDDEPAVR